MNTKLFVGSISWSVNNDILKETFQKYGTVVSANIVLDSITNKSRGFGFVEMSDATEANNAMRELNDSSLDGRNIIVNLAKQRN